MIRGHSARPPPGAALEGLGKVARPVAAGLRLGAVGLGSG
jgi:hypothetical protein